MGQRRKDRELYWRGVFDRQTASSLSVAIFFRQESISAPSFYAWRRNLKEQDVATDQPSIAKALSAAQLLPVHIESSAPPAPVRILLPQGVSIETAGNIAPSVLADLLRVLGETHRC